ncbi:MAG: FliM/FliN family flagellar motor switch protein [Hyphomicrobiaceae bacterium]
MAASGTETGGGDSLKQIFAGAVSRIEELPTLRAVFERAAELFTEDIAALSPGEPAFTLAALAAGPLADCRVAPEGECAVGVFDAPEWGARILTSADRPCILSIVDMLLGAPGTQGEPPQRALSRIELRLAGAFFERFARSLAGAFAAVLQPSLTLESVGDKPPLDLIGRVTTPVVTVRFRLEAGGRTGELALIMAQQVLESMRPALGRTSDEEPAPSDPSWSDLIQNRITRTSLTLNAILDERMFTLGELASLKVGQVLQFDATPQSRLRVECNGEPVLWCHLGKFNGAYTLRVESAIDRDEEFMNDILAG